MVRKVSDEFLNSSVPGDAVPAILTAQLTLHGAAPRHEGTTCMNCSVRFVKLSRDPFISGRRDGSAFQLADLQHLNFATVSEVLAMDVPTYFGIRHRSQFAPSRSKTTNGETTTPYAIGN
jgi:hypothetical protein